MPCARNGFFVFTQEKEKWGESMSYLKKILGPYIGLPKEVYVIFLARIINAMGVLVFPLLTLILKEKIGLTNGEAGLT